MLTSLSQQQLSCRWVPHMVPALLQDEAPFASSGNFCPSVHLFHERYLGLGFVIDQQHGEVYHRLKLERDTKVQRAVTL